MSILFRNNVRIAGHGDPVLVFAHGFGCDQTMWRLVAPAFATTHQVVTFDFVGAGGSDLRAYDEARYATLQGYATDVLEVLDALELRQVCFVGHSVGATIGMLAAARRPSRFARLVHVCASPCYLNDPPAYLGGFERTDLEALLAMMEHGHRGWAQSLAPLVAGTANPARYTEEMVERFCAADPCMARRFAEVTFLSDHRADVPLVPVPSLLLGCRDDVIAPAAVHRWLAHQLPQCMAVTLDATGHAPQLTAPDAVVAALRDCLTAQVAPAPTPAHAVAAVE